MHQDTGKQTTSWLPSPGVTGIHGDHINQPAHFLAHTMRRPTSWHTRCDGIVDWWHKPVEEICMPHAEVVTLMRWADCQYLPPTFSHFPSNLLRIFFYLNPAPDTFPQHIILCVIAYQLDAFSSQIIFSQALPCQREETVNWKRN